MASSYSPLCQCICGSNWKDENFDQTKTLDVFGGGDDFCEDLPVQSGYLAYSTAIDQPLRGVPIREGNLWLLSAEEELALVALSLYVNGFSFTHRAREHSFSLSPFSLVRNCKFQATTAEGVDLSDFKCFKVSLFTQGACFYFGIRASQDPDSEAERTRWVTDISRAMRLVTQSLFPPFDIVCEPIRSISSTHRRFMAGYLLHHEDETMASALYCELHPQSRDCGKMVVYENESCRVMVLEIYITERSTCCEKVGISCSCFSVEDHLFSTRTLAERKLWLRAISNVKVKLLHRAPSPSREELQHYRDAVREHIDTSKAAFQSQAPMDALLHRLARPLFGGIPEQRGPEHPGGSAGGGAILLAATPACEAPPAEVHAQGPGVPPSIQKQPALDSGGSPARAA